MRRFVAVILAACCGIASADGGAGRVLRTEVVVDATPAQLWDAFTTKAGWESWAVPLAEVDFRMGGTIKTNYKKEAGIGGPGTITHHILAYEPQKMLATRFESDGSAAKGGWAKKAEACWVVTRFEPVTATQTRMIETMVGWGDGPEWDDSYEHFKKGNEWSAQQLKKKFAPKEAGSGGGAEETLALLRTMVGGDWIHEDKSPDGKTFRVRNTAELAPDGKSLIKKGWLGGDSGMFFHAATQVWIERGEVRFQDVNQQGGIARGAIHKTGDKSVEWDWRATSPDGSEERYTVTMTFDNADAYTMLLTESMPDGSKRTVVNPTFKRVAKVPPEFLKLRGQPSEAPMTSIDCSLFPTSGLVADPLIKETTVKTSPMDAFKSFATPEGLKSFLVQDCMVDLKIGGPFELYFGGPDVPQESRGSNGCQILSYVPGEMLSFSWNAPPKFPEERAQRAWVVLTFTATEPGSTKVRLVHTGFGQGGHWPEVRTYFDNAWTNVLKALKEHYEK